MLCVRRPRPMSMRSDFFLVIGGEKVDRNRSTSSMSHAGRLVDMLRSSTGERSTRSTMVLHSWYFEDSMRPKRLERSLFLHCLLQGFFNRLAEMSHA